MGVGSFGWSTLVEIAAATPADRDAATAALAAHLLAVHGAPDAEAAYAAAAGLLDRYGFESLPASVATVSGLRLSCRVRKQDAVPAETRLFVQSGAAVAQGPNDAPDTTYRYFSALFPTDPATGAAWTPAGVNAMSAGIERIV